MTKPLAFLFMVLLSSPALAQKPPPSGPTLAKVTKVQTVQCNTDGGSVSCSTGTRYLGELIQSWFNLHLPDEPIACTDGKPGTYTFRFGYEYNDGTMIIYDSDKVQAKWPACVKEFAKKASDQWLVMFKAIREFDPSVDVRNEYKVTVQIKK